MSIQSEIDRISANVRDTLAVLSAAGVDTTGANSDNLAALVRELANSVSPYGDAVLGTAKLGKTIIRNGTPLGSEALGAMII